MRMYQRRTAKVRRKANPSGGQRARRRKRK